MMGQPAVSKTTDQRQDKRRGTAAPQVPVAACLFKVPSVGWRAAMDTISNNDKALAGTVPILKVGIRV
jgi:hypothetical protein